MILNVNVQLNTNNIFTLPIRARKGVRKYHNCIKMIFFKQNSYSTLKEKVIYALNNP